MKKGKKPATKPRAAQLPAAAQHQHAGQLPHLPEAVLAAILQHVPLRARLSACALVCKGWAVAVASTTADVAAFVEGPDKCRRMQDWLQLWAGQVSSIELYYSKEASKEVNPLRLLLPSSKLTQLTSLALSRFAVAFDSQHGGVSTRSRQRASTVLSLAAAANSSSGGSAAMLRVEPPGPAAAAASGAASFLPALRKLTLSSCRIKHDSFLQLSQLAHLTSLHLHEVVISTASRAPVAEQQADKAVVTVLQQLQELEHLDFGLGVVLQDPAAALAPLSTMQHLQRLELTTDACRTAALAHLPSSLTCLDLRGFEEDYDSGVSFLSVTPSSLPQLPLLRSAQLSWVNLEPKVLAVWSSLTRLMINNVLLQPLDPDDGEDEPIHEVTEAHLRAFLAQLGKLTQLQDLSLHWMDLASVPDMQLLSALTASTQLTGLAVTEGVRGRYNVVMPLPIGALQQMFSPGQQWPLLQSLHLEVNGPDVFGNGHWCVDDADISRLASCLPALDCLALLHVVKDGDTVAALTQLVAGLTHLSVGGVFFDDDTASALAQLTSLKELEWGDTDVTSGGLQALTALTNLNMLIVRDCPCVSEHMLDSGGPFGDSFGNCVELYTTEEAEAAGTSDVWEQLEQLCRHEQNMR